MSTVSEKNTVNLYRFNTTTGGLKQLTFGKLEAGASCTPDGKWVVYDGDLATDNVRHILKISIDGGEPVDLAHGNVARAFLSPDGVLVAYIRVDGQGAGAKSKFIVQKLEGGAPVELAEAPSDAGDIRWRPDGRAVTYLHTVGSARNLYMQPLTGGSPVQLTHFDSEPATIMAYDWSRDGKKIAIGRARYNDHDVVLFSGFR